MKHLIIGFTPSFSSQKLAIPSSQGIIINHVSDLIFISLLLVHDKDIPSKTAIAAQELGIPFYTVSENKLTQNDIKNLSFNDVKDKAIQEKLLDDARQYQESLQPPFWRSLKAYTQRGNKQFDCPGHQGGKFFKKHPIGKEFFDYYGKNIFISDLCNADVELGNLLIHEGPAKNAEQYAAKVFCADKTYFVLNGTSAANKMVLNALLSPGDLIYYDRNNHKSICHGALIQAGAIPIYGETARNAFGNIGGMYENTFDETYIRQLIAKKVPRKAKEKRPFRLAVIQLGTYDGTIYNARYVIDKIGHLCDYILFDSAWVGYEQFIPIMKDCSPLLLELGPDDPGIFVTQSVHKQQAGFSQASQVHKKDKHIKGQNRYLPHKRLNNAFMMHASTSPFYPIFASLEMNAAMHQGKWGEFLWNEALRLSVEVRKSIIKECKYIRPFIPFLVYEKPWEKATTEAIIHDKNYFLLSPGEKWHGFTNYGKNQYLLDPCKLQLITPGIDIKTGTYEEFGIPANILATYLREEYIIPEKSDLNTILFLLTPSSDEKKLNHLVKKLREFEILIEDDCKLEIALPQLAKAYHERYQNYSLRKLCQEMHDFYKNHQTNQLQEKLFQEKYLPEYIMTPQEANYEFVRGKGELVPLKEIEGRIALEGALPYPPGVNCVQPGERWSKTAQSYFLMLEEAINRFPGFSPEIQGVYLHTNKKGEKESFAYVLKI